MQLDTILTLQPDGVVQSPLRTTPKDPSPSLPNKHRSFSLIRQVKLERSCVLDDIKDDFFRTEDFCLSLSWSFSGLLPTLGMI